MIYDILYGISQLKSHIFYMTSDVFYLYLFNYGIHPLLVDIF